MAAYQQQQLQQFQLQQKQMQQQQNLLAGLDLSAPSRSSSISTRRPTGTSCSSPCFP